MKRAYLWISGAFGVLARARTNPSGYERHTSYANMVFAKALERAIRWIVIAAVIVGVLLLVAR